MSRLDLSTFRERVVAYAQMMCTKEEFRNQASFDAAAHAAAEIAPKLFLEVERLQIEDRLWAETILAQRDAAIETVARVRALLDDSTVRCGGLLVVLVGDLRKALDGGDPS